MRPASNSAPSTASLKLTRIVNRRPIAPKYINEWVRCSRHIHFAQFVTRFCSLPGLDIGAVSFGSISIRPETAELKLPKRKDKSRYDDQVVLKGKRFVPEKY